MQSARRRSTGGQSERSPRSPLLLLPPAVGIIIFDCCHLIRFHRPVHSEHPPHLSAFHSLSLSPMSRSHETVRSKKIEPFYRCTPASQLACGCSFPSLPEVERTRINLAGQITTDSSDKQELLNGINPTLEANVSGQTPEFLSHLTLLTGLKPLPNNTHEQPVSISLDFTTTSRKVTVWKSRRRPVAGNTATDF